MIRANLPEQSNAADWLESIELRSEDDDTPLWSTIPPSLVVSLYVKDSFRNWQDTPSTSLLSASSNDGSGRILLFDNGFVNIEFPASSLSALKPKVYDVLMKLEISGRTMQMLVGAIPIYSGE
jgi:hypothetical protein